MTEFHQQQQQQQEVEVEDAEATQTSTSTTSKVQLHLQDSPTKSISIASTVSTNTNTTTPDSFLTTAEEWYSEGERLLYDPQLKQIVHQEQDQDGEVDASSNKRLRVFCRAVVPQTQPADEEQSTATTPPPRWTTFLPGNPEGSFGFSRLEDALSGRLPPSNHHNKKCIHHRDRCDTEATAVSAGTTSAFEDGYNESYEEDEEEAEHQVQVVPNHRLYLDYIGQGDSDTATTLQLSLQNQDNSNPTTTIQLRADLVEAIWQARGIERTVVVAAEESSLVVLELLQRQRVRLAQGQPFPKIMHVLSLNGRHVAKTRHTSQLPVTTQLLRSSDRSLGSLLLLGLGGGGMALAKRAQTNDLILGQCLHPAWRGLRCKAMKRQVAQHVVRRHNGCLALRDMALVVDEHLTHKYRWHLPLLIKHFCSDQGITFRLLTTHRAAKGQVSLVQQHLKDYQHQQQRENDNNHNDKNNYDYDCNDTDDHCGVAYQHLNTSSSSSSMSTMAYLLGSTYEQLQPLLTAIQQLEQQEIPLSDNTTGFDHSHHSFTMFHNNSEAAGSGVQSYSEQLPPEASLADNNNNNNNSHDNDIHHSEPAAALPHNTNNINSEEKDAPSVDTRINTEICFDTSHHLTLTDMDEVDALL